MWTIPNLFDQRPAEVNEKSYGEENLVQRNSRFIIQIVYL